MAYSNRADHNEYQRKRMARNRAEYLTGKSCANCGSTEQLEIDHIDPAEKITSHFWGWSRERREAELAKCQVLCHDCHLEKTYAAYPGGIHQHGTNTGYEKRKCRCAECRAWNAAKRHRIRAKAKERATA